MPGLKTQKVGNHWSSGLIRPNKSSHAKGQGIKSWSPLFVSLILNTTQDDGSARKFGMMEAYVNQNERMATQKR